MADKLVSVNDDYDFPKPVAERQAARLGDATTAEGAAVAAKIDARSTALVERKQRPAYATRNNDFRQIPVVMFHQFSDMANAVGTLKDYLAWGYTPIFYSEMMEWLRTGDASALPTKPIVFTDDDGGLSVYTHLFPAMQQLGVKMTCFMVPDWTDGVITKPANGGTFQESVPMSWAQANEMQASGLTEFQSHTKAHGSMRLLTGAGTFTPGLTTDGTGAGADFLYCKKRIEEMIPGSNVKYNAAPYGVINQAAMDSLRDAGCEGNRITETGRDLQGTYDGSGPTAFVTLGVDPYAVPIADGGLSGYIRRANVFGVADVDGNMVENGKFTQTSRGWTAPSGWNYLDGQTLPTGANPAKGMVMRGLGANIATAGLVHTKAIPVGYYGAYTLEYWLKSIEAPPASIKVYLDTYINPTDATPVSSLLMPSPEGGAFDWRPKRWYAIGTDAYQWIKLRFVVEGATATTQIQLWDVKVRRQRTEWGI